MHLGGKGGNSLYKGSLIPRIVIDRKKWVCVYFKILFLWTRRSTSTTLLKINDQGEESQKASWSLLLGLQRLHFIYSEYIICWKSAGISVCRKWPRNRVSYLSVLQAYSEHPLILVSYKMLDVSLICTCKDTQTGTHSWITCQVVHL